MIKKKITSHNSHVYTCCRLSQKPKGGKYNYHVNRISMLTCMYACMQRGTKQITITLNSVTTLITEKYFH